MLGTRCSGIALPSKEQRGVAGVVCISANRNPQEPFRFSFCFLSQRLQVPLWHLHRLKSCDIATPLRAQHLLYNYMDPLGLPLQEQARVEERHGQADTHACQDESDEVDLGHQDSGSMHPCHTLGLKEIPDVWPTRKPKDPQFLLCLGSFEPTGRKAATIPALSGKQFPEEDLTQL